MKIFLVLVPLIAVSMAQRPTYAGSRPIGRPELASRFRDPNETSTQVPLFNRVGEDGNPIKIPVDARGDAQLVDRLNQWPREHRPFWLLNAEQIEAARNTQRTGSVNGSQQDNVQGTNLQGTNLQGTDLQSRGNFVGGDASFSSQESRPIRPNPPRSTFLGRPQ